VLAACESGERIDFEKPANVVGHGSREWRRRPNRCAIHERIKSTEVPPSPVDHRPGGVLIAKFSAECGGVVAGFGQFANQLLRLVERCIRMDRNAVASRG
jgi:hypothetical protein